jgi:hypothetical protein
MSFKNFIVSCSIFGSALAYGGQPNVEEDPFAAYVLFFFSQLGLGLEYRFSEQVGLHTEVLTASDYNGLGTTFVYFPKGLNGWNVGIGIWGIERTGLGGDDHCYSSIEGSTSCDSISAGTPYKSIDTRIGIGWATGESFYFGVDVAYLVKTIYLGPSSYPDFIAESDKERYSDSLKNDHYPIYHVSTNFGFRF